MGWWVLSGFMGWCMVGFGSVWCGFRSFDDLGWVVSVGLRWVEFGCSRPDFWVSRVGGWFRLGGLF